MGIVIDASLFQLFEAESLAFDGGLAAVAEVGEAELSFHEILLGLGHADIRSATRNILQVMIFVLEALHPVALEELKREA